MKFGVQSLALCDWDKEVRAWRCLGQVDTLHEQLSLMSTTQNKQRTCQIWKQMESWIHWGPTQISPRHRPIWERHYSSHGNYIATVNIHGLEPFQNPISKIETWIWSLITPMKLNQIEHANTPSCWRCLNTRSNSFDICSSKSLFEWLVPIFWAICVLILQMNIIVRKIFFLEPKLNFMWIETFLMN